MFQPSIARNDGIKLSLDVFKTVKDALKSQMETGKAMREWEKESSDYVCQISTIELIRAVCFGVVIAMGVIGYFWHFASLVVQVISYTITGLELAQDSYSGPTYWHQLESFNWTAAALDNINWNIGHQHTQMRDQLQTRHTTMINVVNAFTNCRVELHGYDVTRDVNGPTAKELLLQADLDLGRTGQYSCKCLIYPDAGCPTELTDAASRRRLGLPDSIKVATIGNQHGEKMQLLITQNEDKTMKELGKLLNTMFRQEQLILSQRMQFKRR